MTPKYDVCSPRKRKDGKTHWHKVGACWQGEKGLSITFDSLPLPDAEGRVSVFLFDFREKGDGRPAPTGVSSDLNDEIPF